LDAKVIWKNRLSFTATADSGFTLPLGTDPNVGGDNDGFRPMELFALGLAGCTAMDVASIMSKKRQEVTDFEVQVHIQRASEHPKVFTSALIEYFVTGHAIDEESLVRSIELSATQFCPAQAMLGKIMPIEMKYTIYEAGGDEERVLVTSRMYTVPVGPLT
jgi:putative redox protein